MNALSLCPGVAPELRRHVIDLIEGDKSVAEVAATADNAERTS